MPGDDSLGRRVLLINDTDEAVIGTPPFVVTPELG